ncbi:MAG: transcriptional repressor [Limnochordia bacterium]|jgi:Fe2+ or Zn2+ uptake regulation protein|nr:transcriptional repressor [Limnochordia bacterium]MDD4517923.1 transcriptional repressor [Limnochordia bacterium]
MVDVLDSVFSKLKSMGYRITNQRKYILEVLAKTKGKLTAQEVHERVSAYLPQVSLDTVYRNLTLLGELGIVDQMYLGDKVARFVLQSSKEHHHHLVCVRCGRFCCVDICPMEDLIAKVAKEQGFEVTGHSFEVYGVCADCR